MSGPVSIAELVETVRDLLLQAHGLLCQREHLATVALAVHHSLAISGGHGRPVHAGEAEPSSLDGREVYLRCVVVAGVCGLSVVQQALGERDNLGLLAQRNACEVGRSARRGGQVGGRRDNDRIGVVLTQLRNARQRSLQDVEQLIRTSQEVLHRLVLDRDGGVLQAQQVLGGGLRHRGNDATRASIVLDRSDNQAVSQVEVCLPVDGIVLIGPGHVPDRDTRPGGGREASILRAQAELAIIPLDEQRERLTNGFRDNARDHAHPPAVVVNVDAAVQILGVLRTIRGAVALAHHVPGHRRDGLACRVVGRTIAQVA